MSKLEVLQKGDPLLQTNIPIHLKAHVSYWVSWIYIPDNVLHDHIQAWCLYIKKGIAILEQ